MLFKGVECVSDQFYRLAEKHDLMLITLNDLLDFKFTSDVWKKQKIENSRMSLNPSTLQMEVKNKLMRLLKLEGRVQPRQR